MPDINLIDLMFGGMEKLGPGSEQDTLKVLGMLPRAVHGVIVDAGCGAGRQTLTLAKRLQTLVHAVDNHEPFLASLAQRAGEAGMGHLIQTHCMDMADIPKKFREIDLLWSEGSAYSIGFPHALKTWRPAVKPGGLAVVSELAWLKDEVPPDVRQFFRAEYPDMRSMEENLAVARAAGYKVLGTHMLGDETWVEGYYDVLEPRAKGLLKHNDPRVKDFAAAMLEEIRVFNASEGSYGYAFFILQAD